MNAHASGMLSSFVRNSSKSSNSSSESTPLQEVPVYVEILFVRHGYSCANAWQAKGGAFPFYSDPELTKNGLPN
jgi:hypothetical protein